MKLKRNTILLLFVILFSGCGNPERNTMVFEDKIENVQDSISRIMFYLNNLPVHPEGLNRHYSVENDNIYINRGIQNRESNDLHKFLNGYTENQRDEFINLVTYLNKNHINSGYFDNQLRMWLFIYRDFDEAGYNDVRDIAFIDVAFSENILFDYTVLDKKNKLYLIAPKDAKIR